LNKKIGVLIAQCLNAMQKIDRLSHGMDCNLYYFKGIVNGFLSGMLHQDFE
jgi:hypothetical protein